MKNQDEVLLDKATEAMRNSAPESGQIAASADRVAGRLGIAFAADGAIETCESMRPLLREYRQGTLPVSRALLVEAHLRECDVCLRRSRGGSASVDWSAPKVMPARTTTRRTARSSQLGGNVYAGTCQPRSRRRSETSKTV